MNINKIRLILDALDELGQALVDHNHQWTPRERQLYDDSTRMLIRRLITLEHKK